MMMLLGYLHDLDPVVVGLPGGLAIRWYGLAYLVGFAAAYGLMRKVVKAGGSTVKVQELGDMVLTLAIGAVIGGRLGYAAFYEPQLWWGFGGQFPFWDLLAVHRGGMASHGGMLGVIVGAWWYGKRRGHDWGHLLDLAALGTPMGLMLGRVANFINGELYGRACAKDFWLGVQFPQEMVHWTSAQWEKFVLLTGSTRVLELDGSMQRAWWAMQAIREGDGAVRTAAKQMLTYRHPSQLYEAVAEGVVLLVVLLWVWRKPQKPWVVGSWFLMTYAVLRIVCEQFREPDAGIGFQMWGTTRGQILSVGIFVVGLVVVLWAQKRKVPLVGGWRKAGSGKA